MINSLSALMRRLATWRVLAITGATFVVFAGAFFATSLPFSISHVTALCGSAPPDVRFHTTGAEVAQFLSACGEPGRDAYRNLQVADLFYPAVAGLFHASALALILTRLARPGSAVVAMAALPLLGSAFDYLENAAAWTAITTFPGDAGTAANLLGVASVAKQAVSWAAWLILILAIGYRLIQVRQHRHTLRRSTARPAFPATRQDRPERVAARR